MSIALDVAGAIASEGIAIEPGPHGVPMAVPEDEAGFARVLRRASDAGARVVPLGLGSRLGSLRPETRERGCDLYLSTRSLRAVVAYEPGDGTLTAQAGCRMAELARTVLGGGHRLTPDVDEPERTTLGGAIAGATSGCDRERYGPVRHHVLGLRVALADGTIARSGGRRVKNVTGFDLHRLHCGARGTLGVILEASLRLFPEPEAERALVMHCSDLEAALAGAALLREARLIPLATVVEDCFDPVSARLHVILAGRRRQLELDAARARERLAALSGSREPVEELDDAAARAHHRALFDRSGQPGRPPALCVTTQPSAVLDATLSLHAALATSRIEARVLVQPAVATIAVFLARDETGERELLELVRDLRSRLSPIHAPLEALAVPLAVHESLAPRRSSGPEWDWMERVRAALDPRGTLSSPLFPSRS